MYLGVPSPSRPYHHTYNDQEPFFDGSHSESYSSATSPVSPVSLFFFCTGQKLRFLTLHSSTMPTIPETTLAQVPFPAQTAATLTTEASRLKTHRQRQKPKPNLRPRESEKTATRMRRPPSSRYVTSHLRSSLHQYYQMAALTVALSNSAYALRNWSQGIVLYFLAAVEKRMKPMLTNPLNSVAVPRIGPLSAPIASARTRE